MRTLPKRVRLTVGSIAVLLLRTAYSTAQESGQSPLDMFPKVAAGRYGANTNADYAISVYEDQTCTSRSSGKGAIVTTLDGGKMICLSDQGFTFYDSRRNILYSSQMQTIEPGLYGKAGIAPGRMIDMSITVISAGKCYSQASGPGLTVVTPDILQKPKKKRNLLCLSPHGNGYTLYNFLSKKSFTAETSDRAGSSLDTREIRYEVAAKIMDQISRLPSFLAD